MLPELPEIFPTEKPDIFKVVWPVARISFADGSQVAIRANTIEPIETMSLLGTRRVTNITQTQAFKIGTLAECERQL